MNRGTQTRGGHVTSWFQSVPWLPLARAVCAADRGSLRSGCLRGTCAAAAAAAAAADCSRNTSWVLLRALTKAAPSSTRQCGLACGRRAVWQLWPGTWGADSGVDAVGTGGPRGPKSGTGVCMEKSGCSPFPVCWAKGTRTLPTRSLSVLLKCMLL